MRSFKKILCTLLASCILITGCSGNTSSDNSASTDSTASTDNSSVTEDTSSDIGTGIVAEDNIYIEGNKFMLNGEEIWLNGMNAPWQRWDDFGGGYSRDYWDKVFKTMHDEGFNSCRIWINCSGTVGVQIDDEGYVTGATELHWQHLDSLFELAKTHEIYIMATLMSFDHFKSNKMHSWRDMIMDTDKIDSYVNNYIIPFCQRYDSNDYVWSIDLINEPDWVIENEECGKLPWDNMGDYFARACAAIHENTDDMMVTVGMAMIKYNSTKYNGNYASDEFLQSRYDNENAYVDFWSPHYYDWMAGSFGIPFTVTAEEFGIDTSKPCVVGECSHKGIAIRRNKKPLEDCYEWAYNNGWQGVFGWTDRDVFSNPDGIEQFEAVKLASRRITGILDGTYVPAPETAESEADAA